MSKISIYSLIFVSLSFSISAMHQMPEINFNHATQDGLELFCLMFKMRCYHQLTPKTITSLENRMRELGITPDDDRYISLINKFYTYTALTSSQIKTLMRFGRMRQMYGYQEQHLPNFFPEREHIVIRT